MEKKSAGHTVYQQIRRVSVLGILVAMVLATGAGLWLNLAQERRIRDNTLTAAVQAVSHTLTIVDGSSNDQLAEYVDRTVHGISGIDLFAVYDAEGRPVYFCDVTAAENDATQLETLDQDLLGRLAQEDAPLLDDAQAPLGADYCAYEAVYRTDGTIKGYVMAGLYLSSIRNTAMHTLGVYLLIGMAALTVGSFLSLRLAQRIKSDLLGYEPDAFRDLFCAGWSCWTPWTKGCWPLTGRNTSSISTGPRRRCSPLTRARWWASHCPRFIPSPPSPG